MPELSTKAGLICYAPDDDATHTSLIDLPPELLSAICGFLGCQTVVRSRSVCRRLRNVIDGSLELQYRIALVRDGMTDRRPPRRCADAAVARLTLGERLARLRGLRRAWTTLDWARCVTVPIPGPCCAYELVGGIFCKTQPRAHMPSGPGLGNVVEWWPGDDDGFGNADGHGHGQAGGDEDVPHVFGSRTLSAAWLPGTHDDGRTEVRAELGIPTRDFAMDPSQDLMVLLKSVEDAVFPMAAAFPGVLELHVRTMSTNETHPEARVPALCMPVLYPVTSVCVQIVDDVVGLMYCVDPARPRITVWNWKTGNLVVDCSGSNLPSGTWDFAFVHSRALFVTTGSGSGSLALFTFACDGPDVDGDADDTANADSTPTQPEPDLARQPKPISSLVHAATLQLPPVHPWVRVLTVGTHTGPFLAGCPPGKPFMASNDERIHVLTVQYIHVPTTDGPVTRPRVCAFVHNRTLAAYLDSRGSGAVGPSARTPDDAATVVPWSEWGRKHTRMIHHSGVFQWLRYVHGQRVVMLLPASEAGRSTLQVLDFNPYSVFDTDDEVARAREGDTDTEFSQITAEHVHHPTRIVMPHIFVDDVETALPYHKVRRDVRGDYSGVMIDDEHLVGLKYPAFLTGDMKEIDVFTL